MERKSKKNEDEKNEREKESHFVPIQKILFNE